MKLSPIAPLMLGLVLAGCEATVPDQLPPDPSTMMMMNPGDPPKGPYFHQDVEPLLQAHCQGCHQPGGVAPFSLMTYDDAKRWGGALVAATQSKTMPPWGAFETADCQPRFGFADDMRLSDADIKTFSDWFVAGMNQGDPAKAPPPRNSGQAFTLPRVDRSLPVQSAFTTSGPRDQFRCFVLDPGIQTESFASGLRFVPGNIKVAHHAIAFLDPGRESLSKMGPDGSYECFGGPGLQNTGVLYAWAPGALPALSGDRAGFQLTAGTLIVLQIHYHPLASGPEEDRSSLELMLAQTAPEWTLQILLIGNFDRPFGGGDGLLPGPNDLGGPEFRIPAGMSGHEELMQFTLPRTLGNGVPIPDLKVVAAGTHMHYVGTGMRWSIEHAQPKAGEPGEECMIETPRWNFQWQRGYAYDVAIEDAPEWRPDDRMKMRCVYDNTMANPFVARALNEQGLDAPHDVVLGEQTLDEMCLAVPTIAFRTPPAR